MNDSAISFQNADLSDLHWMGRMLAPKSIAIVGASPRPGSMGLFVLNQLQDNHFPGQVFLVNPRYENIGELPVFSDLSETPDVPDLVLMVIGSAAMESAVDAAIGRGVGGIVVFSNNFMESDSEPPLLERLKTKARVAGIPVCGGNGMGFYNYDAKCLVSFDSPPARPGGSIAYIAHSGSAMTYLCNNDPRLRFNLVVSPGQEINGTVADYMEYALSLESTRVIAIFIETVRDPAKFRDVLERAGKQGVPVVSQS